MPPAMESRGEMLRANEVLTPGLVIVAAARINDPSEHRFSNVA